MSKPETIPQGYTTVTPWIIGKDTAGLMHFLAKAFDAEEHGRMAVDGRIQHAEMRIGTGMVMMFDAPDDWPPTPAFLRLYLPDAQTSFERAQAAGATPITTPTLLAFGDKVGRIRDPFGNFWWLQQRVEEVSEAEVGRRWGEKPWQDAMAYVQSSLGAADI